MAATNASKLKAAAKTVVEKNLQAGKKVQVGGVGESRRHGGHGPAIGELKSKDCHVNGEPLPEEFWGSFPYSLTDEGKAEAAAGIAAYKVTELKAEKSSKTKASSKALQNEDRITLKVTSATGTPKGLICTLFLESIK